MSTPQDSVREPYRGQLGRMFLNFYTTILSYPLVLTMMMAEIPTAVRDAEARSARY